jgi:hypothetical protein
MMRIVLVAVLALVLGGGGASFAQQSTYAPELLGTSTDRFGEFIFGNLAEMPMSESPHLPRLEAVVNDVTYGVEMCLRIF